ncbi:hypothetical protein UPYG_G00352970 [Umbra pygmaea]|uniref:PH domain-containing protein n=1 Tax=Umbra pygmaea TaxID=75934 RepID=A0ABD0VX32_UMBPY
MKDRDKELLVEENFCGTSIIVPDIEGVLYLKEDGKKSWKQRLFLLRASGIYFVPKGKSKTRDLVCFVQFDNVNVYYGKDLKNKYKAPTEFCFVLKQQLGLIKVKCLAQGHNNIWISQKSNWQPSDYKSDSLPTEESVLVISMNWSSSVEDYCI